MIGPWFGPPLPQRTRALSGSPLLTDLLEQAIGSDERDTALGQSKRSGRIPCGAQVHSGGDDPARAAAHLQISIRSGNSAGHPPPPVRDFIEQHQGLGRDFIEQHQGPEGPSFAPQFSF